MKIKDTFDPRKDIDRRIEKVIEYSQDSPGSLQTEISEYVVTERIEDNFDRLLNHMQQSMEAGGINDIGVWVSGFYGSGKSSFTKYLGFALDEQRTIGDQPFIDYLSNQFTKVGTRQLLKKLAKNYSATVVPIDLGKDQIAGVTMEEISTVLYHKVLSHVGYSSKDQKIAQFELMLDQEGKYDEFKAEAERLKGRPWIKIKNIPMSALSIAAQLAPKFFPAEFPDAESFRNLSLSEGRSEQERVRDMLDILRKKSGKEYVIFVLDEVGQYVASRQNLILNLDGLARNLKEIGESKVWLFATAQQTLTEDNPRAVLNAPELYRLNARFPIQIDLEADDIREICYRRLLGKSESGTATLEQLFDSVGQKLRLNSKLKDTSYYDSDLDKTTFINLYPFLPHHFQVLLELLGRLAKTSGGIGLRSAIKIVQDVLIDPIGLRDGQDPLAHLEVGTLANTATIYDGLKKEIERSFRNVVGAVSKAEQSFGPESTEASVAKSIAILQILNNLPATEHNIAALMHPSVDADSLLEPVIAALKKLESEQAIPLSCKDGQYRFLSDAILEIEQEKLKLTVRDSDRKSAMNNRIRDLFLPKPTARITGNRNVSSGLKALHGAQVISLEGEREAVHFVVSLIDGSDYEHQINQLLSESCERSNAKLIYLIAKRPQGLDAQLVESKQCEEIFKKHRHSLENDIKDYAEGQHQTASRILTEVERTLGKAFKNGSFIFRGQRTAVSERSQDFKEACNKELSEAAAAIFDKYVEAPIAVPAQLPEKFLRADLQHLSSSLDPLTLFSIDGGQPKLQAAHPAISSIREYLESRGEQIGKAILDFFSEPPYGWAKDTTRYLLVAMLSGAEIRLRVSGDEITVVGDVAVSAMKTNQSFSKVGVALRAIKPDPERILRAADRITDLTGERVLPTEKSISEAVMQHFPDLQTRYSGLGSQLSTLELSDDDRLKNIGCTIAQLIKTDGSDAPKDLGLEECQLVDDLNWASEVTNALTGGLAEVLQSLQAIQSSIQNLPESGVPAEVKRETGEILKQVQSLREQDDFYKHLGQYRGFLTDLDALIADGETRLTSTHAKLKEEALSSLQASTTWMQLDAPVRDQINKDVESIQITTEANLDGLKQRVSHEYTLNNRLREIREEAEQIAAKKAKVKEEKMMPMPVLRRFESEDQINELIERLEKLKSELPADLDWKF